jgi:hypothetical protein
MKKPDEPKYLSRGLYEGYKNSLGFAVVAYRQARSKGADAETLERYDRLQQKAACLTDLWLRLSKEFNHAPRSKGQNQNSAEDGR